ncbi:ubiquinol oxidase subunit II [Ferrovibrio xuzhouensis]|uniref:Ubiquinol oxidase polypeptide II n=1 Tax=Ferrovibrio xuzhouensis TaxID=1576914 RepID=A0ABV7V983_9PROT
MGGCKAVVLDPAGDVAAQQRDLLLQATGLMLLIIVPVMALTVFFAWRYRHSNKSARYEPDWDHSMQLELVIWGAPLLIIICLGALTWMGTHLLDPYRPLDRIAAGRPVPGSATPLEVDAIALDWKWLFIYPQYGIATVNEMAAPVDRPITFRITASSVMNSFYIPALAGQVYAMPGMETKLHAVINQPGAYKGFSANYSGAGFSGMRFTFHGVDDAGFDKWVSDIRTAGDALSRARYLELERPSENVPVRTFGAVDKSLYNAILNMCVQPGKMCMSEMMSVDARGGLGLAGIDNLLPLEYDKYARRGSTVFGTRPRPVAGLCAIPPEETGIEALAAPLSRPARDAAPASPSYSPVGLRRPEPSPAARPSNS